MQPSSKLSVLCTILLGCMHCMCRHLPTPRGLVQRADTSPWRFAFLGGLMLAGLPLGRGLPQAFEAFPHSFTLTRRVHPAAS